MRYWLLLILALLAIPLTGVAEDKLGTPENPIRIGFNGGRNPGIIRLKADAFTAFLEEHSALSCSTFVAESYSHLIRAIAEDMVDFAFLSPHGFITAEQVANAEVLLKIERSGQPYYWSVILVREDSGIRNLDDLKSKRFAFTHLGSTSGYVIPMSALMDEGIRPDDYFSEIVYAGGHGAVIRMILDGEVDAGATFADDPEGRIGSWTAEEYVDAAEARLLKPIYFTQRIPGDTFTVTRNVLEDEPLAVKRIKRTLLNMGESKTGHTILKNLYNIDGLQEASSSDYDPVREAFAAVRQR